MANDWLSLDTIRELVPQLAGASDTVVSLYVNGVMAAIDKYVGYDFGYSSTPRTFYLDGYGGHEIRLPTLAPVWSIAAVYEDYNGNYGQSDGSFDADDSLLELGTNYSLDLRTHATDVYGPYTGVIRRLGAHWPLGTGRKEDRLANHREPLKGCIKVTAVTGFKAVAPADVVMAAMAEVAARYLRRVGGVAMLSESVDGVSKTLSQMPGSIVDGATAPFATGDLLAALKSYRRIPIGG